MNNFDTEEEIMRLASSEMAKILKVTSELQKKSHKVFNTVCSCLQIGMTELDIAEKIRTEFIKFGITDYWYDVPRIVLVGGDRIKIGAIADYTTKSPSAKITLQENDPIYIDLHPRDSETRRWGDWNSMIIFRPKNGENDEQVAFLKEMCEIHRRGISLITGETTAVELINFFLKEYIERKITPLWDKRKNIGHSLHAGLKKDAKRIFLDVENTNPLGGNIVTIEPSGFRGPYVARFEESVFVPKKGKAVILGNPQLSRFFVN